MVNEIHRGDQQFGREHTGPQMTFEVKSGNDLTEEDLLQLSAFTKEEFEIFKSIKDRSLNSLKEQGDAFWNHKEAKQMAYRVKSIDGFPSRFIFARDSNGNLIGYSMCLLYSLGNNPDYQDTELSFLGVKTTHQHQGIATSILLETNKVLENLCITRYVTNAHPKIVSIMNNLGFRYISDPLPGKNPGRKLLTVFLK